MSANPGRVMLNIERHGSVRSNRLFDRLRSDKHVLDPLAVRPTKGSEFDVIVRSIFTKYGCHKLTKLPRQYLINPSP